MAQSFLFQYNEIPCVVPHKLSSHALPPNTVGIHISGKIIVNDCHDKKPQFAYYLALLAEASRLNSDCILEIDDDGDLTTRIICYT